MKIRKIKKNEYDLLRDFLYEAIFIPEGVKPPDRDIIEQSELKLLKERGYKKASLAVQKANYAVKMYEKCGFKIIDENSEEFIMVCTL